MKEESADKISGVILAGGVNSRFGGKIKTKQLVDGRRIIDRILKVLNSIFDEIILVTNTPSEFSDFQGIITSDRFRNMGPLGGIHAAMQESTRDAIFVVAGDMPYLNRALILGEIESFSRSGADMLIPVVENDIEPLHGIYSISLKARLEDWLAAGNNPEVRKFIETTNAVFFPVIRSESSEKAFTNINSPDDISIHDKKNEDETTGSNTFSIYTFPKSRNR